MSTHTSEKKKQGGSKEFKLVLLHSFELDREERLTPARLTRCQRYWIRERPTTKSSTDVATICFTETGIQADRPIWWRSSNRGNELTYDEIREVFTVKWDDCQLIIDVLCAQSKERRLLFLRSRSAKENKRAIKAIKKRIPKDYGRRCSADTVQQTWKQRGRDSSFSGLNEESNLNRRARSVVGDLDKYLESVAVTEDKSIQTLRSALHQVTHSSVAQADTQHNKSFVVTPYPTNTTKSDITAPPLTRSRITGASSVNASLVNGFQSDQLPSFTVNDNETLVPYNGLQTVAVPRDGSFTIRGGQCCNIQIIFQSSMTDKHTSLLGGPTPFNLSSVNPCESTILLGKSREMNQRDSVILVRAPQAPLFAERCKTDPEVQLRLPVGRSYFPTRSSLTLSDTSEEHPDKSQHISTRQTAQYNYGIPANNQWTQSGNSDHSLRARRLNDNYRLKVRATRSQSSTDICGEEEGPFIQTLRERVPISSLATRRQAEKPTTHMNTAGKFSIFSMHDYDDDSMTYSEFFNNSKTAVRRISLNGFETALEKPISISEAKYIRKSSYASNGKTAAICKARQLTYTQKLRNSTNKVPLRTTSQPTLHTESSWPEFGGASGQENKLHE